MKEFSYKTKGTCATLINFDLDDENRIHNLVFTGGCNGNLKAIARLAEGKDAEEIASILSGNTCGRKNTSCADQLSLALRAAIQG